MKKRTLLLIEILIAFFLVSLCAVPLVTGPLKLHKLQTLQLEKMEKERLADWTFSEIKEMFLKTEIPWEKVPKKGEKSLPIPLNDAVIQIPNLQPRKVKRHFFLKGRGEKKTKDQIIRSIGVYVLLDKDQYEFRVPIIMKKQKKSETSIEK